MHWVKGYAVSAVLMMACVVSSANGQVMPMLPDTGSVKADPSVKVPEFDVASVKPHKADDNMMRIMTKADGFEATNLPLSALMMFAYGIRQDLITGGPGWVQQTRFDVDAKVAADDVEAMKKLTQKQRRTMLQKVLQERFHLQVHPETKDLPVYELVVAKSGVKMKPAGPDAPPDPNAKPGDVPKAASRIRMAPGEFSGQSLPMTSITGEFANVLQRDVIDRTGLTGKYDVDLKWTPEQLAAGNDNGSGDSAPSIFTAVQEQLGLKLQSAKGPVQTLMIDHAELPTEN